MGMFFYRTVRCLSYDEFHIGLYLLLEVMTTEKENLTARSFLARLEIADRAVLTVGVRKDC